MEVCIYVQGSDLAGTWLGEISFGCCTTFDLALPRNFTNLGSYSTTRNSPPDICAMVAAQPLNRRRSSFLPLASQAQKEAADHVIVYEYEYE